jgi:hypothetical protein
MRKRRSVTADSYFKMHIARKIVPTIFKISVGFFCFSILSLAYVAFADSVVPTTGSTGYLVSNYTSWIITSGTGGGGNWIALLSPDGNECQAYNVLHGGVTNGDIPAGSYDMGQTINISRTFGSGNEYCTLGDLYGGDVPTYWDQDGEWHFRVYSDNTFTTLVSDTCFAQGSGCGGGGGGGGDASTTIATSTPPNVQETSFMFGTVVFFLAVAFWERALTITSRRYDV